MKAEQDGPYLFSFVLLLIAGFIPVFLLILSLAEIGMYSNILFLICMVYFLGLVFLAIRGHFKFSSFFNMSVTAVQLTYIPLKIWVFSDRKIPVNTIVNHMRKLHSNNYKEMSYLDTERVSDIDPEFAANTLYVKNEGTGYDPAYNLEQETVFVTFLKGDFCGCFHLDPSDINLNNHAKNPFIEPVYHSECDLCLHNSTVLQINLSDSVRDIETDEVPICESCLDELLQELMNEIDSQYHKKIAAKAL